MTAKPDIFRRRADELVTRVHQAMAHGNRAAAVKVLEQALRGYAPMSPEAFEKLLTNGTEATLVEELWEVVRRLEQAYELEPKQREAWRSMVGKMIKSCGQERALEVLQDAETNRPLSLKEYLGAAMRDGAAGPVWKMDDGALVAEYERLTGNSATGKHKEQLRDGIEQARRRGRSQGGGDIARQAIR